MKPKRRHVESCPRKVRMTREEAHGAARNMRRKGMRVGAYRCSVCAGWHVGHKVIRKPARRR